MKKTSPFTSEAAADHPKQAAEITDKRGYASRWAFSVRHVDNLLAQGMPHLAIGKRRIRIVVAEADAFMREKFATRRLGPLNSKPERETHKASFPGQDPMPSK